MRDFAILRAAVKQAKRAGVLYGFRNDYRNNRDAGDSVYTAC